jgi:hypothetical protein
MAIPDDEVSRQPLNAESASAEPWREPALRYPERCSKALSGYSTTTPGHS